MHSNPSNLTHILPPIPSHPFTLTHPISCMYTNPSPIIHTPTHPSSRTHTPTVPSFPFAPTHPLSSIYSNPSTHPSPLIHIHQPIPYHPYSHQSPFTHLLPPSPSHISNQPSPCIYTPIHPLTYTTTHTSRRCTTTHPFSHVQLTRIFSDISIGLTHPISHTAPHQPTSNIKYFIWTLAQLHLTIPARTSDDQVQLLT